MDMLPPKAACTAWLSVAQLAAVTPTPGRMLICGYASLMDEASARQTMPSVSNLQYGYVDGYCRVFNLVSIVNIRRGLATDDRLVTCTARARPGCRLRVCAFEIATEELQLLAVREARLRLAPVHVHCGRGGACCALLCIESSDEEFRARWCPDEESWEKLVGRFYRGSLYRSDLLPVPSYVLRCLRAHAAAASVANFLDASFLGDGHTSLREHLLAVLERTGGSPAEGWSAEELEEIRTEFLSVACDPSTISTADDGQLAGECS